MQVKTLLYVSLLSAAFGSLVASCGDETVSNLGIDVMPRQDSVSTAQLHFPVSTRTVRTASTVARTNSSWLGAVIDPETGARTSNDFVAQFYVPETFRLPNLDKMMIGADGQPVADSCFLNIYHGEYFGDSLAAQKVTVWEVDTARTLSEVVNYSTQTDVSQLLLPAGKAERQTVSYSVFDQTRPQSLVQGNAYYRRLPIPLSQAFGTRLLRHYYAQPAHFANSYEFAHHVCGGFYFRHSGGIGAMLKSDFVTLDVYFRYRSKTASGADTLVNGSQRFTATDEIIQLPRVENRVPDAMLDPALPYTYVKSPLALHTEATLPIDDIVGGVHFNDTINSASLNLRTVLEETNEKRLPKPNMLLLVRADQVDHFFAHEQMPDGVTSFVATLDNHSTANSKATYGYRFANIGRLVAYLREERNRGAGVTAGDTETERKVKWRAWEQAHPNWNKVVLLPVTGEYSKTTDARTGNPVRTLVRVMNAFDLSSVRLEGGTTGQVDLSVVYSRFKK